MNQSVLYDTTETVDKLFANFGSNKEDVDMCNLAEKKAIVTEISWQWKQHFACNIYPRTSKEKDYIICISKSIRTSFILLKRHLEAATV